MNVQFNAWVRGVLTDGTDGLRSNPLSYFGNRIGNLDKVDTVGGQPHIIIEARRLITVQLGNVQESALAFYDWFTRWNAAAAPQRLMEVNPGIVVPGGPPLYAVVGVSCAMQIQNTCQAVPGLAPTWAGLHAAIAAAELNRVGGVGGAACFLERKQNSRDSKLKLRKKRMVAIQDRCSTLPKPSTTPVTEKTNKFGKSVEVVEKAIEQQLKAEPNKATQMLLDAIKWAKAHAPKKK